MLKSIRSVFFFAIFTVLLAGCHHQPVAKTIPPAPPAPPAPSASITVSPQNVQRGQTAQLTWTTQNASDVSINGIGAVSGSGSRQVTAAESTTYHMVAKGNGGTAEADARLTVTIPEPPRVAAMSDEQLFAQNVKDIFFAYDNADIRADEKSVLDADAQFLAAHPDWQLTIEGHCDERGSEDYNMALGQNRAKMVMDALVRQGVSGGAVKVISLGKERPFCATAENESCWSQNRRAHFVLQKKERASMN